jgi:hypothetical protein
MLQWIGGNLFWSPSSRVIVTSFSSGDILSIISLLLFGGCAFSSLVLPRGQKGDNLTARGVWRFCDTAAPLQGGGGQLICGDVRARFAGPLNELASIFGGRLVHFFHSAIDQSTRLKSLHPG